MLSPFGVFCTYAVLLILTPIIVSSTGGLKPDFLSLIAYHLNLNYRFNKVEPVTLCVGFITIYIYVIIEFIAHMAEAFENGDRNTLSRRASYVAFEHARFQLREMYPSFIVSSFLIYANTTRFDVYRNSFIVLQAAVMIMYSITFLYSESSLKHTCRYFYHSVLLWTLLYAIFPRETSQSIHTVVEIISYTAFGENNYNTLYGHPQRWIL